MISCSMMNFSNERQGLANMNAHSAPPQGELSGQVAWVTGAGRGIGRAIAQELAAAGASVAVMARSADQVAESVALIRAQGGSAQGIVADVTDVASLDAAVREIEATLGAVDLLVNNAAVIGPAGPSWEVDPDAWWRCEEINVRGPFLCARAVLPSMIASSQGRIVNVSSLAGVGPIINGSGYAVSKAALIRWSEILARETATHGITVFSIHPGDVITEMSKWLMSDENEHWLPWARQHFTEKSIPVTRAADLVRWLAAGKGDALSGCFLSVHDDVEQLAAQAVTIQEKGLYTLRLKV